MENCLSQLYESIILSALELQYRILTLFYNYNSTKSIPGMIIYILKAHKLKIHTFTKTLDTQG